jgi:hypothetical protein
MINYLPPRIATVMPKDDDVREIKLTRGLVALVDAVDYEELSKYKWFASKEGHHYYAVRQRREGDKQVRVRMHREIMGVSDKDLFVDHIDRDGLNNTRNNLRIANFSQNSANRRSSIKEVGRTSKFLGVDYNQGKWRAGICHNRNKIFLGRFDTEVQAAEAYNIMAIKLHGEFANLNKTSNTMWIAPKNDDRDYNPEQEQYDYDRLEMEQFENEIYERTEGEEL